MKSTKKIADRIGRRVLADRFGVSSQLVWHHADKNGRFPAAWYDGCCELAGEELPRDLFNWKPLVAAEAPPIPTTEAQE